MKPWSKLQKEIYNLWAKELSLQIHCTVYSINSNRGSTGLPRYWITLEKEIIWDYPKDFVSHEASGSQYPYTTEISVISELIREYIDTPHDQICARQYPADRWGLTDILKAADRRISTRRLIQLERETGSQAARKIIALRLQMKNILFN